MSIDVKNLQLLMTEIYKTRSGLSPPFMKDIFAVRNNDYDLRQGNDSQLLKVHTIIYGVETISFLGNRLWPTLTNIIKQANTLSIFKAIPNVGRARTTTVDFVKYIYHRLGAYHDVYQFLLSILYM